MKKLEKMTLEEMSSQLSLINHQKQSFILGGGGGTPPPVDYVLGQIEDVFTPITNGISNTFGTIEDAAKAVSVWVVDNAGKIGEGALIIVGAAIDLYLWKGGTAPIQGPTPLQGGDGSGYTSGFNPYSCNYGSPGTSFYSVNTDYIAPHGGTGASSNDKNDLCTE